MSLDRRRLEQTLLLALSGAPFGCFADPPDDDGGADGSSGSTSGASTTTTTSPEPDTGTSTSTSTTTPPGTDATTESEDEATGFTGFTSFDSSGTPEPTLCEAAGDHVSDCFGAYYGQMIQMLCENSFAYADQVGPTCEAHVTELFACITEAPCLEILQDMACTAEQSAVELECGGAGGSSSDTTG